MGGFQKGFPLCAKILMPIYHAESRNGDALMPNQDKRPLSDRDLKSQALFLGGDLND